MKFLCLFLLFQASPARTAVVASADGAFTLELRGAKPERGSGNTVLTWSQGRGGRGSVERLPSAIASELLLQRAAKDAKTLAAKGRRVEKPRLIAGPVPFSLSGFGTTSFGYFNAGAGSYSYLIKGLKRSQAEAVLKTLRAAPPPEPAPEPVPEAARNVPPETAVPAALPESVLPDSLPPASGEISLVEGRFSFPKIDGWRFVQQDDGWSLLEGRDWSFALSRKVIAELPSGGEDSVQAVAAGYFARFEIDFVETRGCAASPIEGAELENGWKILLKKYACPEMGVDRRQIVGVVLPLRSPLFGWTGDYDRAESLSSFRRWLAAGREIEPESAGAKKTPATLLAAIGGALGFAAMILLMIWRRRRMRSAPQQG